MKDEESFISRFSTFPSRAFHDVWIIWLTLAIVTTLPYAAAALRTPPGYVFTGVLTAYDDTFTYFAWMRQGADGRLLMCDLFTSEPQSCEFFLPLWSFLGTLAGITRLPIPLMFHVARLAAGLLLLIGARAVAAGVMKSRTRIRYSLWLYAMSGGLGWLVYVLKERIDVFDPSPGSGSVDLNMPEAIAFRSVFAQAHFAVGAALIFASIKLLFSALAGKKRSRALVSGALVSLLAVVHPYLVVVVCAVVAAALVAWPWLNVEQGGQRTRRSDYGSVAATAAAFAATAVPGIGYLVYLNKSNEVLREWLRITDTLSPPPWEYALGFGMVAVLSIFGFRLMWRAHGSYGRLLFIWAAVQAALLYAPVSFQRRLVEGLQLPLSIAASAALFWIVRRLPGFVRGPLRSPRLENSQRLTAEVAGVHRGNFKGRTAARYRRLFLIGVITVASLTNIGFVIGQIAARRGSSTDARRYLPGDLVAALRWLRTNSDSDAVLFSSYLTGNVAPSLTGLHVFLGHYGQTVHSDEKGAQVTAFYTGAINDEAARRLFNEHRVRYVIYGPFEQAMCDSFTPPSWLKPAYRHGDVEVFEVTEELASVAARTIP